MSSLNMNSKVDGRRAKQTGILRYCSAAVTTESLRTL
jgi:hypothetical protein